MFEDLTPDSLTPEAQPKADLAVQPLLSNPPEEAPNTPRTPAPLAAPCEPEAAQLEDDIHNPQPAPFIIENASEEQPDSAALTDWKEALRQDFEQWLATIDEIPEIEPAETTGLNEPDLYSFYEQMAASNVENRKANRRTAEALSQWGDTLVRFDGDVRRLRESLELFTASTQKADQMPRAVCLTLIELLDRMHRLSAAFQTPPKPSFWNDDTAWRQIWRAQQQGFEIFISHLEALLEKEGVTRLETLGKPFDPALMAAVATEPNAKHPHHTVIEELAAGYLRHGELLRPAQVKVTLNPKEK